MQKKCLTCGNLYTKKSNCSKKAWSIREYCSIRCSKVGKPAWNKGIKGSAKPNSGTFKKGDPRCIGNKNREGHTPWNKGMSPSEEIRKKISKTLTGRPTGRTGEKSNFWKGGRTEESRRIKNTIEYKNWRRSVYERDNYTCQACGRRSGDGKTVWLHAHHIKERYHYPELQFEISNGQTLCRDCHRKTENYGIKSVRRKCSTGATS